LAIPRSSADIRPTRFGAASLKLALLPRAGQRMAA